MINLNSKVNAPEFSSPAAMRRKIDALIVENRELKIAREISEKDWIDILAGLSLGDASRLRKDGAATGATLRATHRT